MIDAHQHFWTYNTKEFGWIDDSMAVMRRDFFPNDLEGLQAPLGFKGSIAVQARQSLEESHWLLELANAHPRILGVVGWVDLCSGEVKTQLKELNDNSKFKGVRHVVQDEPDDRLMLRPDFMKGLEAVAALGLTYDLLVFPKQLPAAIQITREFPDMSFVLDHIAKPLIKQGALSPWREQIQELASRPNVFCKVSGMVNEADWKNWRPEDFKPYLDVVFNAFGPERLMFGSDWPVCTAAASYEQVFGIVDAYLKNYSPQERVAVFGGNARKFYGC